MILSGFSRAPRLRTIVTAARASWSRQRDHAAVHRGILLVAPVFWAAFCAFAHPVWGLIGFALHAGLCLPRRGGAAALMLVAFPLCALWFAARLPYVAAPHVPFSRTYSPDTAATLRIGTVTGFPAPAARGWSFTFKEEAGERLTYRVNLTTREAAPGWGATIVLTGRAAPAAPPPNPGQLDMRRVLRGQGAAAVLEATEYREARPPAAWRRGLLKARAALAASLERHVPPAALPLLEASLLNITARVPEDAREAFLRSGMQHILAISGQHIGLLIAFLLLAGTCVRLSRKSAFLLAAALTAAYIPLVGSPVSVVRSGITFACLLPAVLRERSSAGLHALGLTASIDLLLTPHNVLNLGFQLSYAATLALILGARPSGAAAQRLVAREGAAAAFARGALQMTFLSALISLFTYPLLATSTHATTPWGILGNLAAGPPGAAMLVGGLFVWSFDFLLPERLAALATAAGATAGICALALEGVVFRLAALPGALRPIADAPAAWIAALAAGAAITAWLLRRERFTAALLAGGLVVAAELARPFVEGPGRDAARLTFLAVGHGDAALLELPGTVILVDAGDSPRVARNVIAPYLRYRGIARVDALVITHPDRDHYGGATALLRLVDVERIIGPPEPGPEGASVTWDCLRRTAREGGIPWHEGRAGQKLYESRDMNLRLLAPGPELAAADKNDRSLVALLALPQARVLFTGDIEQAGQRALAATWPLWRGAWLKAPHHGSDRTTLPCFHEAAAPPRAVVSCGRRRGFPGIRTVHALEAAGSTVAVTARDGAVTWEFGPRVPSGARERRHLNIPASD